MADGERLKPIEGVVLPPLADVVYQGSPFAAASRVQRVGCGTSLLDMVDAQNVPRCFHPDIQVFIGDQEIARENWGVVRPKPGAEVFIRVNLRGGNGGGKDVLRAVAMIAVMVVAYYVAGPFAAGFFQAGSMAATVASAVVATAVATAGMALVNALIPPPSAKNQWGFDQELGNPYGQITGLRNQAAPYGPIPRVFGKRRMFPMLAGRPYTETIGNDQYLRLLLLVGFGPLKLSDIRLGETPLSSLQGVEVETREGWENDAPVSLYTKAIQEDSYSIVLDAAGTGGIRTTRPNTKEISVEVAFPSGVNRVKDNELRYHEVSISVQYRATGSNGAWINAPWTERVESYGTKNAGELFTRDRTQNGLRRSGRWSVPVGQYDVKVIRNSPKEPMGETGYALWTTLRSIVDTDFLPMKGLSLIAMRIKASGQLNGVPDQINCVAESYLPVYDGSSNWNWQISRSPAWAYAHILRYRGLERVHADNRLHLSEIKAWADACAAAPPNGDGPYWTFDAVIEGGSIFSNLRTVASHGRAAFHIKDGKYSVIRDVPQSVPVQSFSPRNSWGYAGSKVFSDLPHALRVRFPNEEKQFAEDEVIVYAPGYSKEGGNGTQAASTYETLDMPACCRPSQAWREGMYHYAVLLLRPESHTIYADVENLRCQMGSFVRFSHDVIKIGLGWGRVSGVVVSNGNVTHLTLDGKVDMAPGTSYGIRCRKDDFASVVMPLAAVGAGVSTNTVQLATPVPLANAPAAGDLYQFGVSGLESAPMMVKRIAPSDNLTAQITLVDAQPGVWTADSGTIPPFETYITNPVPVERQQPPKPVMRLTSDSSTAKYANDGTVIERVLVSFDALPSTEVIIDHLNIQYREIDTADFTPLPPQPRETASVFIDKVQAEAGYEVRAQTVTATGMASDWNTQQVTAKGKTTPPLPPSTLAATAGVGSQVGQISLAWTLSTDGDLWGTEIWASADNNRANATMVGRVADPGQTFDHALAGVVSRYYWVRSQDLSGNYSTDNPNAADKWFPASATGGVLGQTRSILITDLDPSVSGPVQQIGDILVDVDAIRASAGAALDEATEAKTLAASSGYPSMNPNPVYAKPWESGVPPEWSAWGNGTANARRAAGIESPYGFQIDVPSTGTIQDASRGLFQPSGVGSLNTATGDAYYVAELTVRLDAGLLNGTGMHVQFYNASGGVIGSTNINASADEPLGAAAPGNGVVGRVYRYAKLFKTEPGTATLVPYAMALWEGYFGQPVGKTVTFTKCRIRPAEAGEIEEGKARGSYPTLEARLTDQNTSLVSATAALALRQSATEARVTTLPNLLRNSDASLKMRYWTSGGDAPIWSYYDDPAVGTIFGALGGSPGQYYYLISDLVQIYGNATYTLSFNGDGGVPGGATVYLSQYDANGNYRAEWDGLGMINMDGANWTIRKSTTFTTHPDCRWVKVVVAKVPQAGGSQTHNTFISRIMLNNSATVAGWTDAATAKDIGGRVETSEGVIASISGKVQAWWQKVVQAGDGMAFIQATATDNNGNPTSEVAFGARKIGLYTQVGNGWIEVLKLIGTSAHFAGKVFLGALQQITFDPDIPALIFTPPGGSVKMIYGAGFGANSDCIMWLGPKTTDVSQISRTNGNWAFGTDGKVYYGTAELGTGGGGSSAGYKTMDGSESNFSNYSVIAQADVSNFAANSFVEADIYTVTNGWFQTQQDSYGGTMKLTAQLVSGGAEVTIFEESCYAQNSELQVPGGGFQASWSYPFGAKAVNLSGAVRFKWYCRKEYGVAPGGVHRMNIKITPAI